MPQTEIERMVNAVDPKTMKNIDKILKGMARKTEGEESPGNKVGAKKTKKGKGNTPDMGDMAPRGDSRAFKDAGAHNQVTDEGVSHEHTPLSDRAQAALKATARILAPFKDEISDHHLDAIQQEIGIGGAEHEDEATPHDEEPGHTGKEDVEMSLAIPEGVEEEHHSEALKRASGAYKSHLEKLGYRQEPDPSLEETNATKTRDGDEGEDEEEGEHMTKVRKQALDLSAFPVGQRAQLEAVFKSHAEVVEENKQLVKKTGDLEKQLKEERDHRVLKGFQERARTFKHLGANSEELAIVLKSLAETDPKGHEKVDAILKAADEQLRVASQVGGLFGEIGTRASATGNSAGDRLEALVDSVVAKSDGKSREQVYDEVLKSNEGKRLYAEYKASRPHGI